MLYEVITITSKLENEIDRIISTPKDDTILKKYLLKQHGEIKARFSTHHKWDIKYASGGIMDISFIVRYLIMRESDPSVNDNRMIYALQNLIDRNLIEKDKGKTLIDAYMLFQSTNCFLKLIDCFPLNPDKEPEKLKRLIAQNITEPETFANFDELEKKIVFMLNRCYHIYNEYFAQ